MSTRERVAELWPELGNVSEIARRLGVTRQTVQGHLRRMNVYKPIAEGSKRGLPTRVERPPKTGVRRYLLTCAQNNTWVNKGVWDNLTALAEHYEIAPEDVLVSRITYNISAYKSQPPKPQKDPPARATDDELWYDPIIKDHVCDERVELAPGLVFCGEMNILPTAKRPLSSLETYTGRKSAVFPHVKIAMESVASGRDEATKFNYTTGTVTLLNYIQRKAGLQAEHHHCFGALLVEVDSRGRWWCRQLNADSSNVIYDLDVRAKGGKVTTGHRVEAINWGDLHNAVMAPEAREIAFGENGMYDTLRPRYQFMHDLVDFRARNHHDRANCHVRFARHVKGQECVKQEMQDVVDFLEWVERPWCKTVVVDSNHDNAFSRWLRETDYRNDPVNAIYFLQHQLAYYQAIRDDDQDFHLVEFALQGLGLTPSVRFLREDESFVICDSGVAPGIECGMHGHLGPNGARATPYNLSRMGRKANTGHTHTAGIYDGLYVAGHNARPDGGGYARGPSSWSWSDILTYPNGKRAIVTKWDGRWRAA